MSECACVYADIGEFYKELEDKIVVARKEHICGECERTIQKKEKYRYNKSVCPSDNKIYTHKICLDCCSIIEEFFCGGFCYENVIEDIQNHIDDCDGEISTECLLSLTPRARNMVIGMIQDRFDSLDAG